jgi:hypothetical protein
MARLTVSYSIAFIPGLPRPLALTEVIDDVLGLSSFSSRHTVRKAPGTPDRLDIIVPVDDLSSALDDAACAADELTRIGESLLGLGFVVQERSIRVEGNADNWLPDTFDGAGTRHHAPTALDAAAPLPAELEEPTGDIPDHDLRLDEAFAEPAADQPHDPASPLAGSRSYDAFEPFDPFAPPPIDPFAPLPADPFAAPPPPPPVDGRPVADPFAAPPQGGHAARHGEVRHLRPLRAVPDPEPAPAPAPGAEPDAAPAPPRHPRATLRHDATARTLRRRELVRHAAPGPAPARDIRDRRLSFALFGAAFAAVVVPWRIEVTTGSIVALALIAALLTAAVAWLWPDVRGFAARAALTATATLALVLAFASAYSICAGEGDLRATHDARATVGQSLSAAVSLGAAPGLSLGPGARSVAYAQRLLLLLALAGTGAQLIRTAPSRTPRRDP